MYVSALAMVSELAITTVRVLDALADRLFVLLAHADHFVVVHGAVAGDENLPIAPQVAIGHRLLVELSDGRVERIAKLWRAVTRAIVDIVANVGVGLEGHRVARLLVPYQL